MSGPSLRSPDDGLICKRSTGPKKVHRDANQLGTGIDYWVAGTIVPRIGSGQLRRRERLWLQLTTALWSEAPPFEATVRPFELLIEHPTQPYARARETLTDWVQLPTTGKVHLFLPASLPCDRLPRWPSTDLDSRVPLSEANDWSWDSGPSALFLRPRRVHQRSSPPFPSRRTLCGDSAH